MWKDSICTHFVIHGNHRLCRWRHPVKKLQLQASSEAGYEEQIAAHEKLPWNGDGPFTGCGARGAREVTFSASENVCR